MKLCEKDTTSAICVVLTYFTHIGSVGWDAVDGSTGQPLP